MQDAFGREINYLRLSLTDRCNFRCRYCMPSEGIAKRQHADMLSLEELFEVVDLMVNRLGFNKVRVTGGEPFARRGAVPFMRSLGLIPGIDDLSFTTNAFFLAPIAPELKEAGYRRVNISLDTLRRDRFANITRVDALDKVLAGIAAARLAGFNPIKLNAVALKETLDEAPDLIAFGLQQNLQVRFIELMPILGESNGDYIPNTRVREEIGRRYKLTPIAEDPNPQSAARIYRIDGTEATCGFISSISHPFCSTCNRIRLRGDGLLKPCLASRTSISLMPYIRPVFRANEMEAFLREMIPATKRRARGDYEIDAMSAFGG